MTHYLIHDNGSRPYCVIIKSNNEFAIYKRNNNTNTNTNNFDEYNIKILPFSIAKKIFIGKSLKNSMTDFSLGYGPEFDGNSILVELNDNEYMFIGSKIYYFTSLTPIITFVSSVGNNDVPYPYAIDTNNNYYFFLDYAILKNVITLEENVITLEENVITLEENPYSYYYKKINEIRESENINYMTINNEKYLITSYPDPEKNYEDLSRRLGSPIYIDNITNNTTNQISKSEYIALLSNYNEKIGLTLMLNIRIIDENI